jgi:hypothetical protein
MDAEWDSYGPDARLAATQFTAGINVCVDRLAAHPTEKPAEVRKLGYTPSHRRPEDIVRIRSNGLVGNATSEVARSQVAGAGGPQADPLRVPLEPAHDEKVPAGLDPCSLPAMRMVFDVGNWDASRAVNSPSQSRHRRAARPLSRRYSARSGRRLGTAPYSTPRTSPHTRTGTAKTDMNRSARTAWSYSWVTAEVVT